MAIGGLYLSCQLSACEKSVCLSEHACEHRSLVKARTSLFDKLERLLQHLPSAFYAVESDPLATSLPTDSLSHLEAAGLAKPPTVVQLSSLCGEVREKLGSPEEEERVGLEHGIPLVFRHCHKAVMPSIVEELLSIPARGGKLSIRYPTDVASTRRVKSSGHDS